MFKRDRNASPAWRAVRAAVGVTGVAATLAFGVVTAAPAFAATLPSAPTTITAMVSLTGLNDASCGANTYTGPVFSSIQAAVNTTAAGGTIYVCSGTYAENVTVNKALTIDGVNWNTPLATATPATTVVGLPGSPTISVAGSGGLDAINGLSVVSTPGNTGISASGSGLYYVNNNSVTGASTGISISGASGGSNQVTGNSITPATGGTGVVLNSSPTYVYGNSINLLANGGNTGISLVNTTSSYIGYTAADGNHIIGGVTGISLDKTSTSNTVWNNTISQTTSDGISVTGGGSNGANNVSYNTISPTSGDGIAFANSIANYAWYNNVKGGANGISLTNASNNSIYGNTLTGSTANGVLATGASNSNLFEYNFVNGNQNGITLSSTTGAGGLYNEVFYNDLANNTIYGCQDLSSGSLSGAGVANYWVANTNTNTSPNNPSSLCTPSSIVISGSMPDGTVGQAYTANLTATGGSAPYTWAANGLPAGLSINPSTGAITGTPTTAATGVHIIVTVTDATGAQAAAAYTININAPASGAPVVNPVVGSLALLIGGAGLFGVRRRRAVRNRV